MHEIAVWSLVLATLECCLVYNLNMKEEFTKARHDKKTYQNLKEEVKKKNLSLSWAFVTYQKREDSLVKWKVPLRPDTENQINVICKLWFASKSVEEKGIKAYSIYFHMKQNFTYPLVNYCTAVSHPAWLSCPCVGSVCPYKQTWCHLSVWPFCVWLSCSQWGCGAALEEGAHTRELKNDSSGSVKLRDTSPHPWDFTGVWGGDWDDSSHIYRRCFCNGTSAVSIINTINFKETSQSALLGGLAA